MTTQCKVLSSKPVVRVSRYLLITFTLNLTAEAHTVSFSNVNSRGASVEFFMGGSVAEGIGDWSSNRGHPCKSTKTKLQV